MSNVSKMSPLEIASTYSSPEVIFDPSRAVFRIEGRSIVKDVQKFYAPILNWMKLYLEKVQPENIHLTLDFTYLNASSSKMLLQLIHLLKRVEERGGCVKINWAYCIHDPSAYELGRHISSLMKLQFNFIAQDADSDGIRGNSAMVME